MNKIRYRSNLRDTAGNPAHAATFIRKRLIVLDTALLSNPAEHERILCHERFHFVWVRLGNPRRLAWELLLAAEYRARARGEAGWSAEWRKQKLSALDVTKRTRRWREYCCESFCDTAAWIFTSSEIEVTLAKLRREGRKSWFARHIKIEEIPI
ncbi:MAG TPA: hypothetical protein VFC21_05325 [Bryobacteraceae bacterium]|nr:hypothetical protein [Bryobacteraceae bacterium]